MTLGSPISPSLPKGGGQRDKEPPVASHTRGFFCFSPMAGDEVKSNEGSAAARVGALGRWTGAGARTNTHPRENSSRGVQLRGDWSLVGVPTTRIRCTGAERSNDDSESSCEGGQSVLAQSPSLWG